MPATTDKTKTTPAADTEKAARAPRTPSSFAVVKETPPPAPNSVSGGQLFAALEQIANEPGEWFKVAECKSRSGANSIWSTIKKGSRRTPRPKEEYEFTARIDRENDASKLYARYIGAQPTE